MVATEADRTLARIRRWAWEEIAVSSRVLEDPRAKDYYTPEALGMYRARRASAQVLLQMVDNPR